MYEKDRERALEMYSEIFDEVDNETAVLQLLVSPTRQAVNLARAYDARERKYQGDDGEEPAYQLVIEDLRRQAGAIAPAEPKFDDGQLSLFNDAEAAENVFDSLGFGILPETDAESAAPQERTPQQLGLFPDEDREGEPAPLSPPPAPISPITEETPAQEVDDFSDAVDAFLADFTLNDNLPDREEAQSDQTPVSSIQDEDAAPPTLPLRVAEKADDSKTAALPKETVRQTDLPPMEIRREQRSPAVSIQDLPDMTGTAERKANIPLLILFILLAIPVGILCLSVILPAAALSLAFAAASVGVGVSGLVAAFGFSVFADILLVFGLSLALTAIGLLLLWVFIWLLAGAIPGVVRWLVSLGRKLCYKEVSA